MIYSTIKNTINIIIKGTIMNTIVANDLKVKGVSVLTQALKKDKEAIITVRGKEEFFVIKPDYYHFLRNCELEAALYESQQDIKDGNFVIESVDEHIKRLKNA